MKKIEFFFRNLLLWLLIILNRPGKNTPLPGFNKDTAILFIRLNRIGDALVTTPLIHEIKSQTGSRVIVLADRKNQFIFRNNPSVDEIIIFQKRFSGITSINKIIREKNINAIVDLHDDVSTTVSYMIAIAKVKYKFALSKSNQSLYTHTVKRADPSSVHIISRLLNLSELFSIRINIQEARVRYYPPEEITRKAEEQIAKMNPEGSFLVGINLSAGSKARLWSSDNYRLLLNELEKYNIRIILFCTEDDLQFAKQLGREEFIYPFTRGFDIFAAAIMKIDFLITPDTSVVQIASINRIPMFGIYVKYKTEDMLWTPFNTDFEYVVTEEPTVENISFEEVKKKLIPFLEKYINVKTNS
jgi:ADP-heptose:LPS heptosyltransferase